MTFYKLHELFLNTSLEGRYAGKKLVLRGFNSAVYLVTDIENCKDYIMKTIPADEFSDNHFKVYHKISCPYICTPLFYEIIEDMAYIFFEEYIPAGKMIYKEGLSCADILRLGSDIMTALNLLTELEMPYFDIHMPNILYNHNHFMLCDLCYIGEFNQKLMNEAKKRLYNIIQDLLKKSNSHLSDMLLKLYRQADQENIYEKLLLENMTYASQSRYVFDNSDATLIFGKTERKEQIKYKTKIIKTLKKSKQTRKTPVFPIIWVSIIAIGIGYMYFGNKKSSSGSTPIIKSETVNTEKSTPIPNHKDKTNPNNKDELFLSNKNIKDISNLKLPESLKILVLSDNPISDISDLASLNLLEFLDISYTNVSDLTPLYNFQNLKTLNIMDCNVTEDELELFKSNHESCVIITDRVD